ncbi:unnamed protein product [Schistosoma mattheei]|uniref:DUF7083 domain-containing protein n=1 Tax=Schistosoma mattheei TaxID=31246 RepID=A0A183PC28_9TREM|nr:unnamed protein product [Schistosoma mattheei]
MEALTLKFCLSQPNLVSGELEVSYTYLVINAIYEFNFDGVAGVTFDSWFNKYDDLFHIDLCRLDHVSKVKILRRKLGATECERYSNFILPKNSRDFDLMNKTLFRSLENSHIYLASAKLLENSAKGDQDCVLLLDSFDGRDRIAIHLANALLIANKNLSTIDSSSPSAPTWVVWVLPKTESSSANSISVFRSQSDNDNNTSQRPLKIAYLPCDVKKLTQVDLILTTSGRIS